MSIEWISKEELVHVYGYIFDEEDDSTNNEDMLYERMKEETIIKGKD